MYIDSVNRSNYWIMGKFCASFSGALKLIDDGDKSRWWNELAHPKSFTIYIHYCPMFPGIKLQECIYKATSQWWN